MSRLLTVVNERKALRNAYRRQLEDQYIADKKRQEREEHRADILERREAGEKTELLPEELRELAKAKR